MYKGAHVLIWTPSANEGWRVTKAKNNANRRNCLHFLLEVRGPSPSLPFSSFIQFSSSILSSFHLPSLLLFLLFLPSICLVLRLTFLVSYPSVAFTSKPLSPHFLLHSLVSFSFFVFVVITTSSPFCCLSLSVSLSLSLFSKFYIPCIINCTSYCMTL